MIDDEGTLWLIESNPRQRRGSARDEYTPVSFPGDERPPKIEPARAAHRQPDQPVLVERLYAQPRSVRRPASLGCDAYLRYVDDFALFTDNKRQLYAWKRAIVEHLASLRLTIHEPQAQVIPTTGGFPGSASSSTRPTAV